MPIAYQYQWPAVAAQALTANGGASGLISIANTDGFYVTQIARLKGTALADLDVQVLEVISPTQLYVGSVIAGGQDRRYRAQGLDVSTYTTAASSTIEAAQQNKRLPSPSTVMQAGFEAEPILAHRHLLVDGRGQPAYTPGTLRTVRASAVLTNAYVATSSLDISKSNFAEFLVKFTLGSLTNAIIKFDISDDGTVWYPAQMESNGATTVSGDEAQTRMLQSAMVLQPATAGATYYTFGSQQLGNWMRAQIIGTGVVTNSLAEIKAYAGVL